MKICITGGSGFVGSKLTLELVKLGHSVLVLDLFPPKNMPEGVEFIHADLLKDDVPKDVLLCDAIVHLAGVNIFGRWTPEYKKRILDSRIISAEALIRACKKSEKHPRVFVSASAIGFYGDKAETLLNESAEPGTDFLATVCVAWEGVAKKAEEIGMRRVSVRTGIVLGPNGGMLSKLIPIFKWGIGGPMGRGKQWFSWIHIDDLVSVYAQAITDETLSGVVNAVAPAPVRNREFARSLGKALHRPAFLPVPAFALRLVLGELSQAILASTKVVPEKLLQRGFKWKYSNIDEALNELNKF